MLKLELPYPPSINHYFRYFRGRTVISPAGRAFRRRVCWLLKTQKVKPLAGHVRVSVDLYPPDHRRRDVDNAQKALLDALQHGGAVFDDSQIVWLLTKKARIVPGGKTVVHLWCVDEPGPAICPCCGKAGGGAGVN